MLILAVNVLAAEVWRLAVPSPSSFSVISVKTCLHALCSPNECPIDPARTWSASPEVFERKRGRRGRRGKASQAKLAQRWSLVDSTGAPFRPTVVPTVVNLLAANVLAVNVVS